MAVTFPITPVMHKRTAIELECIAITSWSGGVVYYPYFDRYFFQISAFDGSGPWTPNRSMDGINWDPTQIEDSLGNPVTSITTADVNKIFSAPGRLPFALIDSGGNIAVLTGMVSAS